MEGIAVGPAPDRGGALRAVRVLIAAMTFLAGRLGLDILLGAFTAGVVYRLLVTRTTGHAELEVVESKLEADQMRASTAAAMVGAGMFSIVLFPALGVALARRTGGDVAPAGEAANPLSPGAA